MLKASFGGTLIGVFKTGINNFSSCLFGYSCQSGSIGFVVVFVDEGAAPVEPVPGENEFIARLKEQSEANKEKYIPNKRFEVTN